MIEFFKTPAGLAVFSVAAAAIIIFILDVNYRIFAKRLFDMLFALLFTVILLPLLIVCAVISKVKSGAVYESLPCLGAGGKIIFVREYAGVNGFLKRLPRIIDVLCGRLSFVGVMLMPLADGAFMDDAQMNRFNAKPGLFCHLAVTGGAEITYEEMFALDIRYANKRELFYDIFAVFKSLLLSVRGEYGSQFGKAYKKTYARYLSERGEISAEDIQNSQKYVEDALEEYAKRRSFKKNRWRRKSNGIHG